MLRRSDRLSRREFVRAAVAIGGASALAACVERGDDTIPRGVKDPANANFPTRQHAWNHVLRTDDHGNPRAPKHHVLTYLRYDTEGRPTESDRKRVETAFGDLERAFERSHDGLLFTVSYSPAYFDRFDADPPAELRRPRPLADFEDPALDTPDAVVHLASDHGQAVLAAEEALFGDSGRANGVSVTGLGDVFSIETRRTGFVGTGLPAEKQDVEGIPDSKPVPEESPLYMGFKSGLKKNQASEDRVTIQNGPFAGGTTQHISKIHLELERWYDISHDERVAEMFCPVHAAEDRVEGVGDNLGSDSEISGECVEDIQEHAREYGRVGHSQKSATVREDDSPLILRRDFDSTDGDHAGLHFLALQRTTEDFERTREAMNGEDLTDSPSIGERSNNGILEYMKVLNRGNYLLPPRSLRSLPPAAPDSSA